MPGTDTGAAPADVAAAVCYGTVMRTQPGCSTNHARARSQQTGVAIALAGLIAVLAVSATAQDRRAGPRADEPIGTQRAVIRFLTTDDFPPFNSRDEDGVLTGLNVDLARAICQDLATTCDVQARPWEELFAELAAGRADAVIAAHKVTARSLTTVAFTARYFHTPGRFANRRDKPEVPATPGGLDGLVAGVVADSPHETFLTNYFRNTRIKRFNTPELSRLALQNGQVDIIFGDGISLAFWANGSLSRNCCRLLEGAYFEPAYFGDGVAIAVNKADPELRRQLDDALRNIRSGGRFRELVERYFPIKVY